jgi:DNA modification methylase
LHEAALRFFPDAPLENGELKTWLPQLAKDQRRLQALVEVVKQLPTRHILAQGDARNLAALPDQTIELVVTSPPYWTLKRYNPSAGQLGYVGDYGAFIAELNKVWSECFRVLRPGGRLVIVVGDVCLSRREHGRHSVVPLHASIQEGCRRIGFDNLAPIIWYKIANAKHEAQSPNGSGFLGKPYEPNAVVKNDIEYILMQRKPGGYRKPTTAMRLLSVISERDHKQWFQQIWQLPGASTRSHPAPFPLELAVRLVRMFSFVGDTVLDPFMGTGTTNVACARWGRNSMGYEIDAAYCQQASHRLQRERHNLFANLSIDIRDPRGRQNGA